MSDGGMGAITSVEMMRQQDGSGIAAVVPDRAMPGWRLGQPTRAATYLGSPLRTVWQGMALPKFVPDL